jgi:type IV pilus assembly protein PilO
MPRSFKLPGKLALKDPRVLMRAIIGALLVANLVAAVIAFKPFGGSADDLRRQQESLSSQLHAHQTRLANTKRLVEKVQLARTEGDQFLGKYLMDRRLASEQILSELFDTAKAAGIKMGTQQFDLQPIEGSDTMAMLSMQGGYEGTYANLTKFVNLIDKSPRFLIIEGMQAQAPQQQGGQVINVTLKIDAFVKELPGAAS